MLSDPDLPPELHDKFCSIIVGESERLSRLTNDLLALQRIENDHTPFELQRVNLKGLAHSVIDALEPILRDREANTEIVGEAPDVLGNPRTRAASSTRAGTSRSSCSACAATPSWP